MANVLGEAVVQLGVQGDAALAAELAATEAKLAGVQDQADKTAQAVGQVPANSQRTVTPAGVTPPRPTTPVGVSPPSPTSRLEQADTGRPVPVIIVGGLPPSGSAGVETPRADQATSTGGVAGQRADGQDLNRRNVELRQSVTLERERAKFVANPATTRVKREELKVGRDILQVQRGTRWGEQVRQGDELANGFKRVQDRLGGVRDSLGTFGPALASTFGIATGSIFALSAAADPSLFSTFKASITMAAGAVGEIFSPYIEAAAYGLQKLAGWVQDLDPSIKTWAGRIAVAATAVAGLGVAANATGLSFRTMGAAAAMAGRTITLGFVSNPILGGIIGVTAAVGTLAAAWWGVSKAAEGAAAVMGRVDGRGIDAGAGALRDQTAQELLATLPARQRADVLAAPPDKVGDRLKAITEEAVAELDRLKKKLPADIQFEEKQAKDRYNLLAPEHEQLRKFYEGKLTEYRFSPGATGKETAIPPGTPQFEAVIRERDKTIRNLEREAKELKIELTPGDLAPFDLQREQPGVLGGGRGVQQFKKMEAPQARGINDAAIRGLEDRLAALRRLPDLLGAATAAGAVPPAGGMYQNLNLPVKQRYTTFEAYSESLQLAGLEGNQADVKNAIDQMKRTMERLGERILEHVPNINASMEVLRNVFGFGGP